MNSTFRRTKKKCFVPISLTWSHFGALYRITPWPEARVERQYGEEWIAVAAADDVLAAAARIPVRAWQPYLEFVPSEAREFLARFPLAPMQALQVAARCPTLMTELTETPALTAFVAAHMSLRGAATPCWDEIEAVRERSGIFGVLEWLGLPASRQTLAILRAIVTPDLPQRLLEPVRSLLWEPAAIFALQRLPAITDRQLAHACHALAA